MALGLHRRLRTSARIFATRTVLVVAALTILLGVVRGGSRFFYCPVMHLAFDAPCCSPERGDELAETGAPAVEAPDCCQERHQRAMPATSVASASHGDVAPAPCVAIMTTAELAASRGAPSAALGHRPPVRAGPSPPSARERRAELMVFHI